MAGKAYFLLCGTSCATCWRTLAKIDVTLDNLNKVTGDAADATKDLKLLRNNLDETVSAIRKTGR